MTVQPKKVLATMMMMMMLTKLLSMTMVVEAETQAPPYLARQMLHLAYADIGDEHTPILFLSDTGMPYRVPSIDIPGTKPRRE
jgi:hypothetical protein